jgi:hypothetical protein
MDKDKVRELKEQLRQAMRKPPNYIINGSYQDAVSYKQNYIKANKVLNKDNPKEQELNQYLRLMTQEGALRYD